MKKVLIALAILLLAVEVAAGDPVVETVSYSPAPAIPGQHFNMFIHLKNSSTQYDSEDVTFDIDLSGGNERDSDYPFYLGTGTDTAKTISIIKPGKTALLEYRVNVDPSALDGQYTIVFTTKESGAEKRYTQTISIESRNPDVEVVRAGQVQVAPGQVAEIALTIRNIGNSIARDILVGLEEDRSVSAAGVVTEREYSPLGAGFEFVESLEADKEVTVTLVLAVNPEAEQKTYTIPVTVRFKDLNSVEYTSTSYIGVQVTQEPELDAVVSEISPVAFPGGSSEVSVDLFNVGIGTAKYVVAEISSEAGSFAQEKVFIGTLEADDFDSFKVDMMVSPTVDLSKDNFLNLVLKYKNQYGEEKELVKSIKLHVASQAMGGGFDPIGMIFGLIMLAAQLLGLFVAGKWGYKRFIKKAQ